MQNSALAGAQLQHRRLSTNDCVAKERDVADRLRPTFQVLATKQEIATARKRLRDRGLSCIGPFAAQRQLWEARLRFRLPWLRLPPNTSTGDEIKSWDVWLSLQFIEQVATYDSPMLDLGIYQSELPCALRRLGYRRIYGIDLHPDLIHVSEDHRQGFVNGDFYHLPFASGSLGTVSATSVVEHGFRQEKLLAEVSRVLRSGGYFVASFDYWPEKRDTTGVELFGMPWTIFSRDEVASFVECARSYGLFTLGEVEYTTPGAPVVAMYGQQYTFGWLALHKAF